MGLMNLYLPCSSFSITVFSSVEMLWISSSKHSLSLLTMLSSSFLFWSMFEFKLFKSSIHAEVSCSASSSSSAVSSNVGSIIMLADEVS